MMSPRLVELFNLADFLLIRNKSRWHMKESWILVLHCQVEYLLEIIWPRSIGRQGRRQIYLCRLSLCVRGQLDLHCGRRIFYYIFGYLPALVLISYILIHRLGWVTYVLGTGCVVVWVQVASCACVHLYGLGWLCKGGTGFYLWSYSSSSRRSENPRWCSHQVLRLEDCLLDSCGSTWSAWSSCYGLSASLGILGVPHLLIIVHCGCGWKDYPRVWFASSIVSWSLYLSIVFATVLICQRNI